MRTEEQFMAAVELLKRAKNNLASTRRELAAEREVIRRLGAETVRLQAVIDAMTTSPTPNNPVK